VVRAPRGGSWAGGPEQAREGGLTPPEERVYLGSSIDDLAAGNPNFGLMRGLDKGPARAQSLRYRTDHTDLDGVDSAPCKIRGAGFLGRPPGWPRGLPCPRGRTPVPLRAPGPVRDARAAGSRPRPHLIVDRSRHLATPKGTRSISFPSGH